MSRLFPTLFSQALTIVKNLCCLLFRSCFEKKTCENVSDRLLWRLTRTFMVTTLRPAIPTTLTCMSADFLANTFHIQYQQNVRQNPCIFLHMSTKIIQKKLLISNEMSGLKLVSPNVSTTFLVYVVLFEVIEAA